MQIEIAIQHGFNAAASLAFVDAFRAANYLAGTRHFSWRFLSYSGGAITASNGLDLQTQSFAMGLAGREPSALLMAISTSWNPQAFVDPQSRAWLHRGLGHGSSLCIGLDTGVFGLAELLPHKAKRWCLHEEHHAAFLERFPDATLLPRAWHFDGEVGSAVGPLGSLSLGLRIVEQQLGAELARRVRDYLYLDSEPTPTPTAIEHRSVVDQAVELMAQHCELVLPIAAIAQKLGVSVKQLHTAFTRKLGVSPKQKYLQLRLELARRLVVQTDLKMIEIAVATGFSAPSNFSAMYKRAYNVAPIKHRQPGRVPFELRDEG